MSELLPCPFCGSEYAQVRYIGGKWQEPSAFDSGYRGECCDCGATTAAYGTEAEAIAAWNTRAVRMCDCIAEYAKSPIDGKTIVLHRCSSCHELMRPHMNYCPNCGAKRREDNA